MRKLIAYIISIVFVLSLLLTGCGNTSNSSSSNNSPQQNTSSTSGTKKITVWAWDPNFNIAIMNDAKAIYTKEHPDVQIDVV
ncbi:lactose/L-arabinose transport system substrate-binding protein [Thermoanaerobacter thermohydrosulfuricus]|nr:lactose/L-arabinose transport system substrate-binding protein [Thermoanaerobacter thermohydrosulfuricus]